MKLKTLLREYSGSKMFVAGIQFSVLVRIDSQYCKFQFIPSSQNYLNRLKIAGKERISKKIKEFLQNKLTVSIMSGDVEDAGLSFMTSTNQVEEHLLLMLQ